jgi:hypothetical protein
LAASACLLRRYVRQPTQGAAALQVKSGRESV